MSWREFFWIYLIRVCYGYAANFKRMTKGPPILTLGVYFLNRKWCEGGTNLVGT